VGVRDLLVWRTHGTMINGAVIGLVGPLRYILLTDALLEHLPTRQVEAVMAHEVGHARHRHMPWLAMSMMVGISVSAMFLVLVVSVGLEMLDRSGRGEVAMQLGGSVLVEPAVAVGSLILGLGWFGFVSRRFEWQADVFAVQQLSRTPPARDDGPTLWDDVGEGGPGLGTRVTPEAVAAMNGALEAVADLNHLSRERPSWRHGSIAYRQRRLRAMVDQPLDQARIDRTVRWLKRGLLLVLMLLIAATVWSEGSR
jgi:STE24 endopeptidase